MNNRLFEACLLAEEEWAASFESEEFEHEFSSSYRRRINRLYDKMRGGKYHRTTKVTFSLLVAAAMVMVLTVSSFAYAPWRNYVIQLFEDYTTVHTSHSDENEIPMQITFGYLPEGFILTERLVDNELCELDDRETVGFCSEYHFEDDTGHWLDISKRPSGGTLTVDSEDYSVELIINNGITYIVSHSSPNIFGVYWEKSGVQYDLGGIVSKEEALKMAYQID